MLIENRGGGGNFSEACKSLLARRVAEHKLSLGQWPHLHFQKSNKITHKKTQQKISKSHQDNSIFISVARRERE